mmetsp:Transcript_66520/g.124070  ORF Transcript_66520/g.124070 Transcript_66520/m.124070 type:complete len:92 (-) Transcript_66520:153-428(-)
MEWHGGKGGESRSWATIVATYARHTEAARAVVLAVVKRREAAAVVANLASEERCAGRVLHHRKLNTMIIQKLSTMTTHFRWPKSPHSQVLV